MSASRIGLGLAALGRPGYINLGHREDLGRHTDISALETRSYEVMDAARAAGISYFDAARSYGRAEAFLSSWLDSRGIEPGAVAVASKWGYVYTADWRVDAEQHEVKDLSVENLRRQAEESRALLGDHLRLYQIHSATLESGVFEDTAVREELDRLRAEGLEIGFTSSGPRQRETIERALEVGGFDAVQATWNLLERSAGPALAAAHEAGLRVIVKEALANGRLIATVPDAVAMAAALAQPWADVVLSGAATVQHVQSNVRALDVDYDESMDAELAGLVEDPESYWSTRAALAWN